MDKYAVCNFLLSIFIHKKLIICGRMVGWGTRDPRQGLGLYRLISSRIVLIWQTVLGLFMMRARRWAHVGVGPIE